MLKSQLLHPEILSALAGSGHGSKVLISDGNYPHWTKRGPSAKVVYLNLSPGRPASRFLVIHDGTYPDRVALSPRSQRRFARPKSGVGVSF